MYYFERIVAMTHIDPCEKSWKVCLKQGDLVTNINTLRPRQKSCDFDDIFKCIFVNENFRILNKISLKYVP